MIIVDRIEENYAVCEWEEEQLNIELSKLPAGVKEGDVLKKTECGYEIDSEETQRRREKIIKLQNSLWE